MHGYGGRREKGIPLQLIVTELGRLNNKQTRKEFYKAGYEQT